MDKQIFDARGAYVDCVQQLPCGSLVTLHSARELAVLPSANPATPPRKRHKRRWLCLAVIALLAVAAWLATEIAAAAAPERGAALSTAETTPAAQIVHHEPTQYLQSDLVYFAPDVQDVVPLQAGSVDAAPVEAVSVTADESPIPAAANMIADCTVTYYCTELYPHICGTGDGITASGQPVEAGVSVAVDTSIIPLGSTVVIDYGDGELHYYRADDIGGAIDGHHIDVAVSTHGEALALGVNTATVWWWEG